MANPRRLEKRGIDYESRTCHFLTKSENEREIYGPSNVITNWTSLIDYVKTFPFHLREEEEFIFLSKVEGIHPEVVYSMQITNDFKVNCYNRTEAVPTRRLVGKFTSKLETYSQSNAILEMMDDLEQNLDREVKSCSEKLRTLNLTTTTEDVTKYHRINFLCDQMELNAVKQHGARCNPGTMKDSINLHLRSRNCYNAIRELMVLPHKNTIKSYFGKLGSPGSKQECSKIIQNVSSSLTGLEKHCKILIDEIHIKPGAQYQGGHMIGYAVSFRSSQ